MPPFSDPLSATAPEPGPDARLLAAGDRHRRAVLSAVGAVVVVFAACVAALGERSLAVWGSISIVGLSGLGAVLLARRGWIVAGFVQLAAVMMASFYFAHVVIRVSDMAPAYAALFVVLGATLFPRRHLVPLTAGLVAAVLLMRVARGVDEPGWVGNTLDCVAIVALSAVVLLVDRRRVDEDRALLSQAVGEASAASARARAAAEVARQASDAKSGFLARVSHELRTPINAILGYAELLREEEDGGLTPAAHADLERISVAGRQLLELVDRVLDLSRVESGRLELRVERIAADALLLPVIQVVEPLVRRNGNHLALEVTVDEVTIDAAIVRQILLNLLSNAARFTSRGEITLRARCDAGLLCFEVADSGIGIRAERIPHLFQPFVQAEQDTAFRYGGTGLGLAIVDRQVRAMGGRVEVESEVGRGSTFRVWIPEHPPAQGGSPHPPPTIRHDVTNAPLGTANAASHRAESAQGVEQS